MDMVAHIIGDKVGDVVEGAVKKTLGIKEKPKKGGGGIKSIFGGHKEEEKEKDKGGIFSFGHDKKKEEKHKDEDGGFFSKVFHRHDDEEEVGKQKKSGFQGLFAEGGGGAMRGGIEGEGATGGAMGGGIEGEGEEYEGNEGQTIAVTDKDLLDDLLDVAKEMPKDT